VRLFLLPLLASSLVAQTPDTTEQDLLALLNTPLSVASAKGATLRESPGVVSVITQEEIAAIAPRDINDILRLVPGFQLGYDSQGSVGLMARSMWAYEGKCLVLWNNVDLTERLYGTTTLGDRFPIDQIKRIEIIRGPGSAIYGGDAELVVIKIISRDADDGAGIAGSVGYRHAKGLDAKEAGAMYAGQAGGYKYTVGVQNSKAGPADATTFGYLNVTSDRLTLNLQAENMTKADPEYPLFSNGTLTQWLSQNVVLKYKALDLDGLSITPVARYTKSIPWIDHDDAGGYVRREVARLQGGFDGLWTRGKWGLGFGLNHYTDRASVSPQDNTGAVLDHSTGATHFSQEDTSAYIEGSYSGLVNLTAGGRYDHNSVSGNKFVPRIAVTKTWDTWYAKVLFAEAFRTPDVLNLGRPDTPNTVIHPETTRTFEVEIGNQFGANFISGNLYYSKLTQPLVWGQNGYTNGEDVKATGVEVTYKYKASWGFANLSYAHSVPDNGVAAWTVPGDPHTAVDAAKDQLTGLLSVKLGKVTTGSLNATYLSKRFAYTPAGTVQEYAAGTLLNGNLTFNLKPITIVVGAYDLLNRKVGVLPGYNGGLDGLSGHGLEGVVKVKYGF
jgi:outer membrane cobalamin receptor